MLKMETAQREKNSFLDDLKKQEFIMSENSTVRLEVKDNMRMNEASRLEKQSF